MVPTGNKVVPMGDAVVRMGDDLKMTFVNTTSHKIKLAWRDKVYICWVATLAPGGKPYQIKNIRKNGNIHLQFVLESKSSKQQLIFNHRNALDYSIVTISENPEDKTLQWVGKPRGGDGDDDAKHKKENRAKRLWSWFVSLFIIDNEMNSVSTVLHALSLSGAYEVDNTTPWWVFSE